MIFGLNSNVRIHLFFATHQNQLGMPRAGASFDDNDPFLCSRMYEKQDFLLLVFYRLENVIMSNP